MNRPAITWEMRIWVAEDVGAISGCVTLIRCPYCEAPLKADWRDYYNPRFLELTGVSADLDHIHPLARDGAHQAENIIPTCRRCNRSKGAKTLDEWPGWAGYGQPAFL